MRPVRSYTQLFVALAILGPALAAACAAPAPTATPVPPPVSQVAAGVGLGTVVGAAFAPQKITVPVGATVTWTNASDEGHQVTLFAAGKPQPTGSPRAWAATIKAGETVSYDGAELVHSGSMAKAAKVSVKFPKAGVYQYFCPIHPSMEGTVTVVPAGQPYTTVAQAEAAAKQESEALLALVEPNRKGALALATKTALKDGATLWTVPVGPKVSTPTGYLELKEYFPAALTIKKGDTVRWFFASGHSVTFLPPGQALPSPAPPAAKPSPEYDGKSLYTSGVLSPTGDGPGVFELKFANAGTFPYLCQLHGARLGHTGTITVE